MPVNVRCHFHVLFGYGILISLYLIRPLNEREKKQNSISVVECVEKRKEVILVDKNSAVSNTKTFTFDRVRNLFILFLKFHGLNELYILTERCLA